MEITQLPELPPSEEEVLRIKHALALLALKQGYLIKRGGIVKNWKKRFFVVGLGSAYYYKDKLRFENGGKKKGRIPLRGVATRLCDEREFSRKHVFELVPALGPKRAFILVAGSEEERQGWLDLIHKEAALLNPLDKSKAKKEKPKGGDDRGGDDGDGKLDVSGQKPDDEEEDDDQFSEEPLSSSRRATPAKKSHRSQLSRSGSRNVVISEEPKTPKSKSPKSLTPILKKKGGKPGHVSSPSLGGQCLPSDVFEDIPPPPPPEEEETQETSFEPPPPPVFHSVAPSAPKPSSPGLLPYPSPLKQSISAPSIQAAIGTKPRSSSRPAPPVAAPPSKPNPSPALSPPRSFADLPPPPPPSLLAPLSDDDDDSSDDDDDDSGLQIEGVSEGKDSQEIIRQRVASVAQGIVEKAGIPVPVPGRDSVAPSAVRTTNADVVDRAMRLMHVAKNGGPLALIALEEFQKEVQKNSQLLIENQQLLLELSYLRAVTPGLVASPPSPTLSSISPISLSSRQSGDSNSSRESVFYLRASSPEPPPEIARMGSAQNDSKYSKSQPAVAYSPPGYIRDGSRSASPPQHPHHHSAHSAYIESSSPPPVRLSSPTSAALPAGPRESQQRSLSPPGGSSSRSLTPPVSKFRPPSISVVKPVPRSEDPIPPNKYSVQRRLEPKFPS